MFTSPVKGRIERITLTERQDLGRFRSVKKKAKIEVVKRHQLLRDLEGIYQFQTFDTTDPIYQHLLKVYGEQLLGILRTKLLGGIRLGRALIDREHFYPSDVSRFISTLRASEFRLSCRFSDLLRVAETPHYKTCMTDWRGTQLLRNLADRDVAVIFEPDASGKMRSRAFVRLLRREGDQNTFLGVYRVYGNGLDVKAVLHTLKNRIRVVEMAQRASYAEIYLSWSRLYNPSVAKPIWSDHSYSLNGKNMNFWAKEITS